jgi:Ala-tRNA(Pro) deacylase
MEDESTFNKVIELLAGREIRITEHQPVRTSEEAAQIRGTTLDSGAKAMLLTNGAGLFLAVMSASRKLDSKIFKKLTSSKSLRFATEQEVFQTTKCIPGAVPPFGSIFGVKTYMDESLRTQGDSINFNAGLRTKSVTMRLEDFITVENPVISVFGK